MRHHLVSLFALSMGILSASGEEATGRGIEIDESDASIRVLKDGKPVFQYNRQPTAEAAKHEAHFTRSGYIHPVYSPSGKEITGDYALDHKHQHGLFFAWTKTRWRGKPCEFWNEAGKVGKVRYGGESSVQQNNGSTVIRAKQEFVKLAAPDPVVILNETWKIEVLDTGGDHYAFDLTSTQSCATKDPLTILKYHYGGIAIRGNAQWFNNDKNAPPPAEMITSEGKNRANGNHSRPRWVAMSGPIDGEHCGLAILSHPQNFRYPQWVRLHPSKPYFVFSPMVEEPFDIVPAGGKKILYTFPSAKRGEYVTRMRYLVFDGKPDLEWIEKSWKDFAKQDR